MFRRKLLINLLVLVICGTVAFSIPIIVNNLQTPTSASTDQTETLDNTPDTPSQTQTDYVLTLVSEFVGDRYQIQIDSLVVWQIYLMHDHTVVATWDEIYAAVTNGAALTYDQAHLQLTPYGFCYRGLHTTEDYENLFASGYHSSVTYQGQTCTLTLP